MPGSLTAGVPDYVDSDVEIRNLLQSPSYRDRRRGKLLLEQRGHELARNQQREEFYFRQAALQSQLAETQQNRADINRENEAGRMERARQHNELIRVSQEDNRTRNLISAMNAASYDQSPEGKALLRSLQAEYSRIIGLPVGAPAAAPAGGKGEFGPGGAPAGAPAPATGGKGEYGPGGAPAGAPAPATNMATNNYSQPTQAFTEDQVPFANYNRDYNYPRLPNTPEERFVPLGAEALSGSVSVPGGIRTPSGGFIGGASAQRRHGGGVVSGSNPPPNENMVAAPVGEGYTPPTAAFTTLPAAVPGGAPTPAPGTKLISSPDYTSIPANARLQTEFAPEVGPPSIFYKPARPELTPEARYSQQAQAMLARNAQLAAEQAALRAQHPEYERKLGLSPF